jgi:hypothetical protein
LLLLRVGGGEISTQPDYREGGRLNSPNIELARALLLDPDIAQAAGNCPCRIQHMMPEVLRGAKTVILNRLRMPSPPKMVVNSDLSEEVAR